MDLALILWALVSVAQLTFGTKMKCEDIDKCHYDDEKYANAQAQGDILTLCKLIREAVECMEGALQDCTSTQTNEFSNSPEDKLKMNKINMNAVCPGNPEETSCVQIGRCMVDKDKLQADINGSRIEEACRLITHSVKCLEAAINDCKLKFAENEEFVRGTEFLQKYENFLKTNCGLTKVFTDEETSENKSKSDDPMKPSVSGSETSTKTDKGYQTVKNEDMSDRGIEGESGSQTGNNSKASANVLSLVSLVVPLSLYFGNIY